MVGPFGVGDAVGVGDTVGVGVNETVATGVSVGAGVGGSGVTVGVSAGGSVAESVGAIVVCGIAGAAHAASNSMASATARIERMFRLV
ncbi:MAG: hypothetical protein CVV04_01620 [Firmicutes bacterium HGW-Firmicutes-9]|nr:MAG: hypothetical protein CVV04_01620 [Firmicutes bacterium HGW-Firmicutes-9]